ncbi:hypothetical protein D915_009674 [Fasciola hepatica]|uniref:Tick transposon n=1 Tax=Fasciola hepatica TaxID=6192 RepID=A0A4E0RCT1_FASHE|nr:hypothetical protein D915_009674 [Fasciola hepatica]
MPFSGPFDRLLSILVFIRMSACSRAACKVGFLFCARRFFKPFHLLLYKVQIRPTLEYCCHAWGEASSSLSLLDRVQRKAIRLVDDPVLTFNLQSLAHRWAVASLSLFYRHYFGFCSPKLASVVPFPITLRRRSRGQAASLIRCLSLNSRPRPSNFFPQRPSYGTHLPSLSFHPRTTFLFSKSESTN